MDKRHKSSIELTSASETEKYAEAIGSRLTGGEVIELVSDLGGGKTAFVKGLARGAGSKDHVTSPSFTLRNDYLAKGFSIAHFDFYRLSDPGILKDMLAEAMSDSGSVVVIEWGGIIDDILPDDRVKISIKVVGETRRLFEVDFPDRYKYLFERAKDVSID